MAPFQTILGLFAVQFFELQKELMKQIPGCQLFSAANSIFGIATPMCSQHRNRSLREVTLVKCNCLARWDFLASLRKTVGTKRCFRRPVSFISAISQNCMERSGWRQIHSITYTVASAEKLDIYHLSPPLRKSPPSLCGTCALQLWLLYCSGKQL